MGFSRWNTILEQKKIEQERLTELWEQVKAKRSFTLIRTVRIDDKKKTGYTFLSDPLPVNTSGWLEYWEKSTSIYDEAQTRPESDTVASSATRYIFRCTSPNAMAIVAKFFFESSDASGSPKNIYAWYQHPFKVEGQPLEEPVYGDLYKKVCDGTR